MKTRSSEVMKLHELLFELGRHRSLRDPIGSLSEKLQLTPPQVHTLLWLGEEGPLTMRVLARRAGITEKTITGVIDRLEGMELVERLRSEEDRRTVSARLTPKGEKLHTDISAHMHHGFDQVLLLMEPEDRQALFRLLERLTEKLKRRAAEISATGGKPGAE
jgi:DNA-binding MarR family transcriptional regulator